MRATTSARASRPRLAGREGEEDQTRAGAWIKDAPNERRAAFKRSVVGIRNAPGGARGVGWPPWGEGPQWFEKLSEARRAPEPNEAMAWAIWGRAPAQAFTWQLRTAA